MTDGLRIASDLVLPFDAVTQTFGFMGRKGSGKSNAAGVLAESMLNAKAQVIALDPVGVWWGLRLAADGKSPGYPIPILGGERGDVPIEPGAGALIARLVVEKHLSAVVDVSSFRKGDRKRFVTDFAEELFHRKKTARSPLHLVLEEAQAFVPQRAQKGEERMIGAFEDIVRIGRNYGIGCSMISQRPQSVNKDVLSQVEALVVLQVVGAHERDAIRRWVVAQGVDLGKVIDELPSLPVGEGYFWSPGWLHRFERVAFPLKWSYDASATPKVGEKRTEPRTLDAREIAGLRESMVETIERAEQNDPTALRRKVRELEVKLRRAETQAPPPSTEAIEQARAEGARAAERQLREVAGKVEARSRRVATAIERAQVELGKAVDGIREPIDLDFARTPAVPTSSSVDATGRAVRARAERPAERIRGTAPHPASAGSVVDLPRGEHAILTATAQHEGGVTRTQLSILTGYKRSTRDAYVQRLGDRGFVELNGGLVVATEAGVDALGADFEPLPTGQALIDYWLDRLPAGERVVFRAVVEVWPEAIAKDELSERTEYARSSRDAYIQRLSARQLVESDRGQVRAAAGLFGGAR